MTTVPGWFWSEENLPGYDLALGLARAGSLAIPAPISPAPRWFWTMLDRPPYPEWLVFVSELSPPLWLPPRPGFHALSHAEPSVHARTERGPKTRPLRALDKPVRLAPERLAKDRPRFSLEVTPDAAFRNRRVLHEA